MSTIKVSASKKYRCRCGCGKTLDLYYCAKHDKFICRKCLVDDGVNCERIRFLPIYHNNYHEGCTYIKIDEVIVDDD